jgi:HlyD family secretion protein
VFQGYIEGEYVYVAAPVGGQLQELSVSRGESVKAGQPLFQLDPEPEQSDLKQAEQRLAQVTARLANLTKGLRPTELAALEASLASAKADARLAEAELKRFSQLQEERVVSLEEMDRARSRDDAARAAVSRLQADLETARLGAREDEVAAAQAEVEAARAVRDQARWVVDQKRQSAPGKGVVDDTLYRVGEWVAAGRPVVSLLPPENVKVRFFVPEPELAPVQVGAPVSISFDGATGPVHATISYISTQAEFTPPVIYSRENRAKLVFMVEAKFAPGTVGVLHPGQPVDVRKGP